MRIYSERETNNMVRKVNNRLYKINTYASAHIIEIDDNYDEEVQKLRKEIQLDSLGYKLNLLVYLATLTVQGYAILSVTEFNIDGSKPRVAYASSKDFKKIVKYYSKQKAQETMISGLNGTIVDDMQFAKYAADIREILENTDQDDLENIVRNVV